MHQVLKNQFRDLRTRKTHPERRPARTSLRLEGLEDRTVPSTLLVDPQLGPKPGVFTTISNAVAAAKNGDVIDVVPGIYEESVNVNKSVTINGGFRANSAQNGTATILPLFSSESAFLLNANNITVENFHILDATDGVNTNAAFSGYHILSNFFRDDQVGVQLNTSLVSTAATSVVSNNTFEFVSGGNTVQEDVLSGIGVRNAIISRNTFEASEATASVQIAAGKQSANVQILTNRFVNANLLVLANVTNALVENNNIAPLPTSDAILAGGGVVNSQFIGNSISSNSNLTPTAVQFFQSTFDSVTPNSGDTISGNTISGSDLGILMGDSNNIKIISNVIHNCQTDGIKVIAPASAITISANTVFECSNNGIHLQAGGNTVSGNVVDSNGESGIFLDSSSTNTVSKNTANNNGADGITVSGGGQNTISNNTVNQNANDGISLDNSNGNTVSNNVANHNDTSGDNSFGIALVGSTSNSLTGNTVEFTSNAGYLLSGTTTTQVTNNVAKFDSIGFGLDGAVKTSLTGNVASDNTLDGFLLEDGATQATFTSNTADSNADGFLDQGQNSNDTYSNNVANNNGIGFQLQKGTFSAFGNIANGNSQGFAFFNVAGGEFKGNSADNNNLGFEFEPSGSILIFGNTATNNSQDGFDLFGLAACTVSGNVANGNGGNGIFLSDCINNVISGNTADNSGGDGINVATGSTGNTISGNTALGNGATVGGFDLFDASGTATANTWSNNKAGTASPGNLA